jgi:hypothetical protein
MYLFKFVDYENISKSMVLEFFYIILKGAICTINKTI